MRTKFVVLCGMLLLISACESTPEESANTAGAGTQLSTPPPPAQAGEISGPASVESAAVQPQRTLQDMLIQEVGDRVFFDFDRSSIRADGEATLRRQAEFLKQNPGVTISVQGHCDERGTREYNLALGERRATAAKNYLVSLGVNPNRIKTISYGKERPIVLGSNESAWAQNRVAVTVLEG